MSTEENVRLVKNFFAAMGSSNARDLLALAAEDIEWIIPGEGWPLAGTHRGHAELAAVLKKASEEMETQYPKPPEFVAQGEVVRVMVVGVATGKIKATNSPFKDEWVFDIAIWSLSDLVNAGIVRALPDQQRSFDLAGLEQRRLRVQELFVFAHALVEG